jgi:small multidrug resistance family-3 protein
MFAALSGIVLPGYNLNEDFFEGGGILLKEIDMQQIMEVARSLFLFLMAGLCEIGGGYMIWLFIREGRPLSYALMGAAVLILYGILPTFQPANFGRVYAAYGGVLIVLSIIWGWQIDRIAPDRFDLIGGLIALIGIIIIMYWPRP